MYPFTLRPEAGEARDASSKYVSRGFVGNVVNGRNLNYFLLSVYQLFFSKKNNFTGTIEGKNNNLNVFLKSNY